MDNITKLSIEIKTDDDGFTGRQCPDCGEYFKIKFGTGLPVSSHICPYCGFKGDGNEFITSEQKEYLESYIAKKFIEPAIQDLQKSIKNLEKSSSRFVKIKVKSSNISFKLKEYEEKILETEVTCNSCGLVFSIYGVFSNCPDCGKLNSLIILNRSLDVCKKKIKLASGNHEMELDLKNQLISDALSGAIAGFDSFGKSLKNKFPSIFPNRPRNLFQNIQKLDEVLSKELGKGISIYLDLEKQKQLVKMFQVRHIFEHNAGVIDNDFIKNIPDYSHLIGRKYELNITEIEDLIDNLQILSEKLIHDLGE